MQTVAEYAKDEKLKALVKCLDDAKHKSEEALETVLYEAKRKARLYQKEVAAAWEAIAAELHQRKLLPPDFDFEAYTLTTVAGRQAITLERREEEHHMPRAIKEALEKMGVNIHTEHGPNCPNRKKGKLLSILKPDQTIQ